MTSEYGDAPADYHLDLIDIDLPDNTWDYIVCHRVIEHLSDDRRGMKELLRILKPGGTLVMSVPIDRDLVKTIEYGKPNPLETDHYYRYGKDFEKRIPQEYITKAYDFRDLFKKDEFKMMSLVDDTIFICQKPDN
jgi:SAM-dependent methyltransferase